MTNSAPVLSDQDILKELNSMGCHMKAELLKTPNDRIANSVFSRFLEITDYSKSLEEIMLQGDEEECEFIHDASYMGVVFKLMKDIGVDDFNINDVWNPKPNRFKTHLCALIDYANFSRSREEWEEALQSTGREISEKGNSLINHKMLLEEKIESLKQQGQAEEGERKSARKKLEKERKLRKTLEASLKDNENEEEKLNMRFADLNEDLNAETNQVRVLQKDIKEFQEAIVPSPERISRALKESKIESKRLKEENKNIKKVNENLESKVKDVDSLLEAAKGTLSEMHKFRENFDFLNKLEEQRDEIKNAETLSLFKNKNLVKLIKELKSNLHLSKKSNSEQTERNRKELANMNGLQESLTREEEKLVIELGSEKENVRQLTNELDFTNKEFDEMKQFVATTVKKFQSAEETGRISFNSYEEKVLAQLKACLEA